MADAVDEEDEKQPTSAPPEDEEPAPAAEENVGDDETAKTTPPRAKSRVSFIQGDVAPEDAAAPEEDPEIKRDEDGKLEELYKGMEPYPEGHKERRQPSKPLESQIAVVEK